MEHQQQQQVRRKRNGVLQVQDGSEIWALVENKEAFTRFVDDRFRKLDADGDGRLSVKELQPAVADIGAAIGLPARGSSPQADHIYAEVPIYVHTSLLQFCFASYSIFVFTSWTGRSCSDWMHRANG